MKIRRLNGVGAENRWLLVLPALALALGCESKTETSAEATDVTPSAPRASLEQALPAETGAASSGELGEDQPTAAEGSAAAGSAAEGSAAAPSVAAASSGPPSPGASSGAVARPQPSAPAASDDSPRRGPAASGEGFNTWLEGKSRYALNQPASVTLVLTADAPFKCNDQYPYKFTLTPPSGLTVTETVLKSMNVGTHRSTLSIPFTPNSAGTHTLSGELSFSVCTEDKCLIEKQAVSIPIEVGGS